MRLKGKLVKWNTEKAFGFIEPNGGGDQIFIHKTALSNRNRNPQVNDVITFGIAKDNRGRYCAESATFSGEKLVKKQAKQTSKLSIYLSTVFLISLVLAYVANKIPDKLIYIYLGMSLLTFIAYALDKAKAKNGGWRTQERTLHLFSLFGGWPGAAFAQQFLRHKSQKREFRMGYWFTMIVNIGVLVWLLSPSGITILKIFQ
jgi:uncharacterized membrane protein YsdA (DUF1294 family)/cold shock CspA family protein